MTTLDDTLCCQTVTLYRKNPMGIRRQVVHNAFYSYLDVYSQQQEGLFVDRTCLLVLPGQWDIAPGDRVFEGEGPQTVDWDRFVPALVPGLTQLTYARPYFWRGQVCHVEAGRK